VLVVKKTVPPGTPAEELGDRVGLETMVEQAVADGAVSDVRDLRGRVTSATLVPGEQVVDARFVEKAAVRAGGAAVTVPPGLLETTLKLDPERALGGALTPGDHVAVTASFDDKNNWPAASSHVLFHDVLVTNVQVNDSADAKAFTTKDDDDAAGPGSAPTGQLLVTLALDVPSVERLVFAAERGSVWLSIEPDDAATADSRIVTRSNVQ
jgi:pilus assembly protein CpaB